MSYWQAKDIRYARALQNHRDWESPTSLKLARHMARDGASVEMIKGVCGWQCSDDAARYRLKKYNIPIRTSAHFGRNTTIPHEKAAGRIDVSNFRPKNMRSA